MSDFHKCTCPSCGQKFEYPPDGMGQTIPCPTCQKPLKLLPDIVIPSVPTKKQPNTAPTRPEKGEREIYVSRVRSEPATEKQKEKLRYFGYPLNDGMTKGEASDALDECVKKYPLADRAYYGRPATEEQLAKIRKINASCAPDEPPFYDFEEEEPDEPLTYGEAKEVLRDWDLHQRKLREEQEEKEMEEFDRKLKIDEAWDEVNSYAGDYRPVSHEEVAKAWDLVKSRQTSNWPPPSSDELLEALEELFPDFKRKTPDPNIFACPHCPGKIKFKSPRPTAYAFSARPLIADTDIIRTVVKCPDCGGNIPAKTLDLCDCICPHCSKVCSALKSHTRLQLRCPHCFKNFSTASPISLKNSQSPTIAQLKSLTDSGFKIDAGVSFTAEQLNEFLKLEGMPPRVADKELVNSLGIQIQNGDAFAIYGVAVLARRLLEMMQNDDLGITNLGVACLAAQNDPAYLKATITLDKYGQATFAWPESKLKKWYRMGM